MIQAAILSSNRGLRSCGCMVKKRPYAKTFKHGMTDTPEHRAWLSMIERCTNPNHKWFHRYGGRGVAVCERWQDFTSFFDDMGKRPDTKDRYSLDRIDNNRGYEPGNCRWATTTEQNRNRVNVKQFELNGVSKLIPQWAEEYGIPADLIWARMGQGWTLEEALHTPYQPGKRTRRH